MSVEAATSGAAHDTKALRYFLCTAFLVVGFLTVIFTSLIAPYERSVKQSNLIRRLPQVNAYHFARPHDLIEYLGVYAFGKQALPLRSVAITQWPKDNDLAEIDALGSIRELHVNGGDALEHDLVGAAKMSSLKWLFVAESGRAPSSDLTVSFPRVVSLSLGSPNGFISKSTLSRWSELSPNLKYLKITDAAIDRESLLALARFKSLARLALVRVPDTTDATEFALENLPNLMSLEVEDSILSANFIQSLKLQANLTRLTVFSNLQKQELTARLEHALPKCRVQILPQSGETR